MTYDKLERAQIAMNAVWEELKSAMDKFPAFHSVHEGYGILAEEVAELFEAVRMKQGDGKRRSAIEREAIQVAAMALRMVIDAPGFRN